MGTSLSYTASATDVSPAVQAAGFTYAWNFGDGSTGSGATASHTFASAGTYTVTVTATDEYGKMGTASETITISARPPQGSGPTVIGVSPASGATGIAVSSSWMATMSVTATFNQPVQPSTINFTMTDSSGNPVAATFWYSDATNTVTLTPDPTLANSATYTMTLSGSPEQQRHRHVGPGDLVVHHSFSLCSRPYRQF